MSKFQTTVEVPSTVGAIRCDASECGKYETNMSNSLRRFYHSWIKLSGYGIEVLQDELDFCSFRCLENWLATNRVKLDVAEAEAKLA